MKRAFILAVALAAIGSTTVFAYSESEETDVARDRWFENERMRTEGYTQPRLATPGNGGTRVTCPTPEQQRRDRDFLRQLQLTDGRADWVGLAEAAEQQRMAMRGNGLGQRASAC